LEASLAVVSHRKRKDEHIGDVMIWGKSTR
jgi:hypothetical protein